MPWHCLLRRKFDCGAQNARETIGKIIERWLAKCLRALLMSPCALHRIKRIYDSVLKSENQWKVKVRLTHIDSELKNFILNKCRECTTIGKPPQFNRIKSLSGEITISHLRLFISRFYSNEHVSVFVNCTRSQACWHFDDNRNCIKCLDTAERGWISQVSVDVTRELMRGDEKLKATVVWQWAAPAVVEHRKTLRNESINFSYHLEEFSIRGRRAMT